MADEEISTLIGRQQEIICFLDPLIAKQEEIKILLDDKIKEIRMHHLGCNIARSIGAGTAAAGASLAVSSLLKLSIRSPVLTAVGLGAAVVGKLVTFVTDSADEVKGKTFIKNARDIVALQNNLAERLKEKLHEFQQFLVTTLSSQSKEMLENTGLSLKERFGRQQSSLVRSHSDLCGNMSVDIDFQSIVKKNFIGRCAEVRNLVKIVQMSETLMPTVAAALQAIGFLKEIQKIIQSWRTKHPSEEAIHAILEHLLESTKTLKLLRKELEANVALLEETLSVITATVAYEEIKDHINLFISKQEKTLNWAVQKEAKLSIPYRITHKIIMIMNALMNISILTAIAVFVFGLHGEVAWGSLKIIAICLSIATPLTFFEELLFENFVKTLGEEIADRECSVHNLRKKLDETNQHPRLGQLLETGKKISYRSESVPVEEAFGSTLARSIIEASIQIGVEIRGLARKKSTSKRLSRLQDLLIEASVILEVISKLGYIGSAIGRWSFRNNIKERLVSQMPDDLINYTRNVRKLLEYYKEAHKSSQLISYRL